MSNASAWVRLTVGCCRPILVCCNGYMLHRQTGCAMITQKKSHSKIQIVCSDVDVGGETYFRRSTGCSPNMLGPCAAESSLHPSGPTASGHSADPSAPAGLRIRPKQGRAIMFWYDLPDGHSIVIHCTCVTCSGGGAKLHCGILCIGCG